MITFWKLWWIEIIFSKAGDVKSIFERITYLTFWGIFFPTQYDSTQHFIPFKTSDSIVVLSIQTFLSLLSLKNFLQLSIIERLNILPPHKYKHKTNHLLVKTITHFNWIQTMKHKYASESWKWAVLTSREDTNIDLYTKCNVMDSFLEDKNACFIVWISLDLARLS